MIRENVQVYIYSLVDKKVLLLKRTEDRSGYWQPVCGGIEEEESIKTAAIREVLEETGLTDYNDLVILPNEYSYYESKNGIEMHMKDRCTLMIIDKICEIKLSYEHESYNWCYLNEVPTFNDWKQIIESIEFIESRFL